MPALIPQSERRQGTDKGTDQGRGVEGRGAAGPRLVKAKSSREGSDFEAGEGELARERGRRGLGHQAELRGALEWGSRGRGGKEK